MANPDINIASASLSKTGDMITFRPICNDRIFTMLSSRSSTVYRTTEYKKLAEQLFKTFQSLQLMSRMLAPEEDSKKQEALHERIKKEEEKIEALVKKANSMQPAQSGLLKVDEPFCHYLIRSRYETGFFELALMAGLDFSVKDKQGVSALAIATQARRFDLVQLFVEKAGLKVDVTEPIHPLLIATNLKDTELMFYFLNNLSQYSLYGDTLLTVMSRYGNADTIKAVPANTINGSGADLRGNTPLMHAACNGKYPREVIPELLAINPDMLQKNQEGQTVFHLIFQCSAARVELFFDVDPRFRDYIVSHQGEPCGKGYLPVHYALNNGHETWVDLLLENNRELRNCRDLSGRSLIFSALTAKANHLQMVKKLHEKYGLPLDDTDDKGVTLFEHAIVWDAVDVVEYMLDKGMGYGQYTALLSYAVGHGLQKMIECLLLPRPRGATQNTVVDNIDWKMHQKSIDAVCLEQITRFRTEPQDQELVERRLKFLSFMMTAFQNQLLPVEYFSNFSNLALFCLDYQILDINAVWGEKAEPLFHILERNFASTRDADENAYQDNMISLLKYKPDWNKPDGDGLSLLVKWIKSGTMDAARMDWISTRLNGIKTTSLDAKGSSLLHVACEEQQIEVIKWASDRGLSIVKSRKDGMSALDCAVQSGNSDNCAFLVSRLSSKQWKEYLKTTRPDIKDQIIAHGYYGRNPVAPVLPVVQAPVAKQHDDLPVKALAIEVSVQIEKEEVSPVMLKPDWDMLMTAIKEENDDIVKSLQKPHYQADLKKVIGDRVADVLLAAADKHHKFFRRVFVIQAVSEALVSQGNHDYRWLSALIEQNKFEKLRSKLLETACVKTFIRDQYPHLMAQEVLPHADIETMLVVEPTIEQSALGFNSSDFHTAIDNNDSDKLQTMWELRRNLDQKQICNLVKHAINKGDPNVLGVLLNLAYVEISSCKEFWNKAACLAMENIPLFNNKISDRCAIVDQLFLLEAIRQNTALYDNRLLHTAIACEFHFVVSWLLTAGENVAVQNTVAVSENRALRKAIEKFPRPGYFDLIALLLNFPAVRKAIGVHNNSILRQVKHSKSQELINLFEAHGFSLDNELLSHQSMFNYSPGRQGGQLSPNWEDMLSMNSMNASPGGKQG